MSKKSEEPKYTTHGKSTNISQNLEFLEYKLPAKSLRKKVWNFMNSTLFIWFLSSVVVVGISNVYNSNKIKNELQSKRIETVEKLNSEISYRLFYVISNLETQKVKIAGDTSARNIYSEAYSILDNYYYNSTYEGVNYSLHTEYFQRPFASLIFELKSLDSTSTKNVENAFIGFDRLDKLATLTVFEEESVVESIEKSLEIIRSQILNPEWQSYFILNPADMHKE